MALTTGAFLSDSGNPLDTNGDNGDHYRNTVNQDLWFKVGGSWTLVGNLNDNTPDGIGTIWLNGSGVPLTGNGANGDYYRNTDNQDVWFKVGGFWTLIFGTTQLTSATSGVRSVNGIQPDGNGDVTLLVEDLGGAWPDLPAHVAAVDPHGDRAYANGLVVGLWDGIPAEFDTFADLNTTGWTIPRIIVVDVDETNGNLRTTYFFDGVTTQWVPLVEI